MLRPSDIKTRRINLLRQLACSWLRKMKVVFQIKTCKQNENEVSIDPTGARFTLQIEYNSPVR